MMRRDNDVRFAWVSGLCASALAVVALGLAFSGGQPADAAQRGKCTDRAGALGVSRVVEVDTTGGPKFGHQQYKDYDFLAPGEIVLTFDDGPLRHLTQAVVDALENECTKATFFMVGSQAVADPDMVRQIQSLGHTVGTHTWSHANLAKSSPLKARDEVELGFSAVTAAAGQPIAPFFRFPYLADKQSMLSHAASRNFGVFSIEVDSLDYRSKDAAKVHSEILRQLEMKGRNGKGILLFHDIQASTARALPGLLAALKAKGYKVVHMKPKAAATTLPEYDAMAAKYMGRKNVASANKPLARRGVTWSMPEPGATISPPTGAVVAVPAPGAAPVAGVPAGTIAGAGSPVPQAVAPPLSSAAAGNEPPPRPNYRRRDPDWRDKIFSSGS